MCTDQHYKNVLEKFHFCSYSEKFQHFQNFKKQLWRDDQRHIYRTLGYKIQQCWLTYTQATTSTYKKKLDNLHILPVFEHEGHLTTCGLFTEGFVPKIKPHTWSFHIQIKDPRGRIQMSGI